MASLEKEQEISLLRNPAQRTLSHPWLMMREGREGEKHIFYSISECRHWTRNIPGMKNNRIISQCMEWLVLLDYDNGQCSLLNLTSMDKVELPKLDKENTYGSCCLTSPPGDPNCHVLVIGGRYKLSHISLCQPGDDKFITRKIQFPEQEDNGIICALCLEGSIYGVALPSRSLIRASIDDPTLEFQTLINGESLKNEIHMTSCYLTESRGELLLVNQSCLHKNVCIFHVFRADFSTMKWVFLRSIDDRAIFLELGTLQGITCSTSESGIQGNSIYYMGRDRILQVINLEDQSFRITVPCPTLNATNLIPTWLMIPPENETLSYS